MHLTELRSGPHPRVADRAVARAASDQTVAGPQRESRAVLAPYRRQILSAAAAAQLVVDFDLNL